MDNFPVAATILEEELQPIPNTYRGQFGITQST